MLIIKYPFEGPSSDFWYVLHVLPDFVIHNPCYDLNVSLND